MNRIESIYVKKLTENQKGVFSMLNISKGTIVESCDWLPVTQKTQILLLKNDPVLASALFPNPEGIAKEKEILSKFAELELQERLDRGLITVDQFKKILSDTVNPTKMLNVVSHSILLGFGSIYRRSERPNLNWEYDAASKLYYFREVEDIYANQELTYFSK